MKKNSGITPLLGIGQENIAMLLQVSRSQWSMYELGERNLPIAAKRLLAEMLGFLKFEDTPKPLPQLQEQEETTRQRLELLLKENGYQQYELAKKIATLEKKYTANVRTLQLMDYLSKNPETAKALDGELLQAIASKASRGLSKTGLADLTTLRMKEEVVQLEKLLLESALRKMTQNPQ